MLVDPVTETFDIRPIGHDGSTATAVTNVRSSTHPHAIEITFLPGVTDTVAENLVKAAHRLGLTQLERAATGQRYDVAASLAAAELTALAESLYNPVIQRVAIDTPIAPPFVVESTQLNVDIIPLRNADDEALLRISAERRLALDLDEMRAIRDYFQSEGREPTDAELEMLAQTWSEHCVHKTFRARIDYSGPAPGAAQSNVST